MHLQTSKRCCCAFAERPYGHAQRWKVCCAFWSREPDAWDAQWEAEEQLKRQQLQQRESMCQSAAEAAWRQQVDQVHQQLLNQQKHKAALRSRLQQDAQRAKQDQLRRIAPVAKARARARGLATLGLDPDILSLSEKFGRMSQLVDEVQQQMEARYGLMQQQDSMYLASSGPAAVGAFAGSQYDTLLQQRRQQGQLPDQQQQQRRQQVLQQVVKQEGLPGVSDASQAVSQAAEITSGTFMQQQLQPASGGPAAQAAAGSHQLAVQPSGWQQQQQTLLLQPPGARQLPAAASVHNGGQRQGQQQQLLTRTRPAQAWTQPLRLVDPLQQRPVPSQQQTQQRHPQPRQAVGQAHQHSIPHHHHQEQSLIQAQQWRMAQPLQPPTLRQQQQQPQHQQWGEVQRL